CAAFARAVSRFYHTASYDLKVESLPDYLQSLSDNKPSSRTSVLRSSPAKNKVPAAVFTFSSAKFQQPQALARLSCFRRSTFALPRNLRVCRLPLE
ncbi:MAG: hypothetical protein ACJ8EE_16095, partial [Bradyrhizobium sp.]